MQAFQPIEGGALSPEFSGRMMDSGYLPTAMCAIGHVDDPSQILTIAARNDRLQLPPVSIGSFDATDWRHDNAEQSLTDRLEAYLGIVVVKGTLQCHPLAYEDDFFIYDLGFGHRPNLHYRLFFPATGLYRRIIPMVAPPKLHLKPQPIDELKPMWKREYNKTRGKNRKIKGMRESLSLYEASLKPSAQINT